MEILKSHQVGQFKIFKGNSIYNCLQNTFDAEYIYDISKAYVRGTYTSSSALAANWSKPTQFTQGNNG